MAQAVEYPPPKLKASSNPHTSRKQLVQIQKQSESQWNPLENKTKQKRDSVRNSGSMAHIMCVDG
jgi:hypothetical protein